MDVTITRFDVQPEHDVCLGMLTATDLRVPLATLEPMKRRIPMGDYVMIPENTGEHRWWRIAGGQVYWEDKPRDEDWNLVEMHVGNYRKDTEACPLVGMRHEYTGQEPVVRMSEDALTLMASRVGHRVLNLRISEASHLWMLEQEAEANEPADG